MVSRLTPGIVLCGLALTKLASAKDREAIKSEALEGAESHASTVENWGISALDLLLDEELRAAAQEDFKKRLGETVYEPILGPVRRRNDSMIFSGAGSVRYSGMF